jgi:hypothetical protein
MNQEKQMLPEIKFCLSQTIGLQANDDERAKKVDPQGIIKK